MSQLKGAQMKKSILYISCFFLPALGAVSPQPGENIWYLAARIGVELDQISLNNATCCNGTFTTLNAIAHTTCSKLDEFNTDLQDCCTLMASTVDSIDAQISSCCANIDGNLTTTDSNPLIIDPTGTTITAPGYYCLANDVTLSGVNTIAINANDVVLSLNNHTVTGGQGLRVLAGNNRITIQNGAVNSSATSSIALEGTNDSIILKNLIFNSSLTGVIASTQTNLLITQIDMYSVTTGISLITCNNCIVQDCNIIGRIDNSGVVGIVVNPNLESTENNCLTFRRIKADSFSSGFIFRNVSSMLVQDCIACNNLGSNNATDAGFVTNDNSTNFIQKHVFSRCISIINGSHGFLLTGGNNTVRNSSYIVEDCIAIGKTNVTGNGFNVSRRRGTFNNCKAILMQTGFSVTAGIGLNNNFIDCIADKNTSSGFNTAANNATLIRCVASSNASTGMLQSGANNMLESCMSNNNSTGFIISATSATINCSTHSNTIGGFTISSANTTPVLLTKCQSTANGAKGFELSTYTSTQNAIVERSFASDNGTNGFNGNGATNNTIFYLNSANNNGTVPATSNFVNLGTASANTPTGISITSASRAYGNNLRGN